MDRTLLNKHTRGCYHGSVKELSKLVTPAFVHLVPRLLDAGFHVGVVTFSDSLVLSDPAVIASRGAGRKISTGSDGVGPWAGDKLVRELLKCTFTRHYADTYPEGAHPLPVEDLGEEHSENKHSTATASTMSSRVARAGSISQSSNSSTSTASSRAAAAADRVDILLQKINVAAAQPLLQNQQASRRFDPMPNSKQWHIDKIKKHLRLFGHVIFNHEVLLLDDTSKNIKHARQCGVQGFEINKHTALTTERWIEIIDQLTTQPPCPVPQRGRSEP